MGIMGSQEDRDGSAGCWVLGAGVAGVVAFGFGSRSSILEQRRAARDGSN